MKAVILAAGVGKRLLPLTESKPKVMLPVLGKPLLEYQVERLRTIGVATICINLHAFPEIIREYFDRGQSWGVVIHYAFEPELLGTGGVLRNFSKHLDSPFFLVFGDVYHELSLLRLWQFHHERKSVFTIVVRKTNHPKDSDLILIDDLDRIRQFFPKPHHQLPDTTFGCTGLYLLDPIVFRYFPSKRVFDIDRDFIPMLLRQKLPLHAYLAREYILDMGTPERYQRLQEELSARQKEKVAK